jgi:GDP-L-fucose synthase
VRDVVYPDARLVFDSTKPDGMPRKLLDVSRLNALGWRHRVELPDGIATTYEWFLRTNTARGTENAEGNLATINAPALG